MIRPIAGKQGIELIDKLCAEGTAVVRTDYLRLRQVVINLLSNAVKYNRPRGSVTLSCETTGGVVRISVVDTGEGIPRDKQERIFTAFDRLGKETGTVEGTGIGLVISKRLVEAMGGHIGFESVESQGSTFWLELPVADSADLPIEELSASASTREIAPLTVLRSLLYIEDNTVALRLMQKVIAKWPGLELRGAPTAEIGIALAHAEPPDLILMDINLPGMDGYEALAQLKADPVTAHIPVIAVTANAMKGDHERAQAAGFAAYLTKPIDISILHESLSKALANSFT
jgi:hypothetical protein